MQNNNLVNGLFSILWVVLLYMRLQKPVLGLWDYFIIALGLFFVGRFLYGLYEQRNR